MMVNLFFVLSFLAGMSAGIYQLVWQVKLKKADPQKFPPSEIEVKIVESLRRARESLSGGSGGGAGGAASPRCAAHIQTPFLSTRQLRRCKYSTTCKWPYIAAVLNGLKLE